MAATEITPLILTYNEAPNIRRTLERLTWAKEIVVVDSFSTDDTLTLAGAFPQARALQRRFDEHSLQWNYGVDQCTTDWVLALDADYILDWGLVEELKVFRPQSDLAAYFAHFRYCIAGRPLRGTLYPPRAVLFERRRCHYEQDGHTQRLRVDGNTGLLLGRIDHDDRKLLSRWIQSQRKYAELEVVKILRESGNSLSRSDRLRLMVWPAAPAVFLYTLLWKRCILDGWHGWHYVFQRTFAELLLSLEILDRKLSQESAPGGVSREAPPQPVPDAGI